MALHESISGIQKPRERRSGEAISIQAIWRLCIQMEAYLSKTGAKTSLSPVVRSVQPAATSLKMRPLTSCVILRMHLVLQLNKVRPSSSEPHAFLEHIIQSCLSILLSSKSLWLLDPIPGGASGQWLSLFSLNAVKGSGPASMKRFQRT